MAPRMTSVDMTARRGRAVLASAPCISVVSLQVHAGIERGDLLAIAVEDQGGPALPKQPVADAPFGGLAPTRMVDRRIDVGVEAILARVLACPRGLRLLLDELDANDRFDSLEAVFPRDDQADRRAVLIEQGLAVKPDRQNCQRMHRLDETQTLDVRPGQGLKQST